MRLSPPFVALSLLLGFPVASPAQAARLTRLAPGQVGHPAGSIESRSGPARQPKGGGVPRRLDRDALESRLVQQYGRPEEKIKEFLKTVDASQEYWDMVERNS